MDANRKPVMLCTGLLAALGGCMPMFAKPTAKDAQPVPSPPPPSEVVKADTEKPIDPGEDARLVSDAVQGYLQRVGNLEVRVRRPPGTGTEPPFGPAPAPLPPSTPAVDAQPLPAAPQPGPPPGTVPRAPDGAPSDTALVQPTAPPTSGVNPASQPAGGAATQPAAPEPPPLRPPAMASVTARGEPPAAVSALTGELPAPQVNTPVAARQAPLTLRQFLEQWPGEADEPAFQRQLDVRVLRVIAGDYEGARQPLAAVSTEQQEMAARFTEGLIAIREAHDGDPGGAANRVLAELDRLRDSLGRLSELRIPTLAICQEVVGYGQYRPIEPPVFRAGVASEFVAYCEVRGFLSEKQDDGLYCTRFEMRTRVLNSAGDTLLDLRDTEIADRCRQRRVDCFIPRLVRLPATLAPGEYVAKVTIVDKLGEKVAENRATFRVVAGP